MPAGCVFSGPPGNTDFDSIKNINELAGVYRNHGESSNKNHHEYLSSFIWKKDNTINHSVIETIEVRPVHGNALVVKAHGKSGILKESTFVEGSDFVLSAGRIILTSEPQLSGSGAGSIGMAAGYFRTEIGLDSQRHGKSRNSGAVVGYLLIVPFAFAGFDDVRFSRIGD